MSLKIGIPRALLYYDEFIVWKTFFENLEVELIISEPTTKHAINQGLEYSIDDICLPVKIFMGHVRNLMKQKVDMVFIPRIVSLKNKTYSCPKLMGLPDIVKNVFRRKGGIEILTLDIDYNFDKADILRNYRTMASRLSRDEFKSGLSIEKLGEALKLIESELATGCSRNQVLSHFDFKETNVQPLLSDNPVKIGVTGHSYILYDKCLNMGLFKKMRDLGVEITTPEMLSEELIDEELEKVSQLALSWHLGQRTLGASLRFLFGEEYHGVIHLSSFSCGLNSVAGKMIELKAKAKEANPLLQLNFDEHTTETALVTRLEAFIDILKMKREKQEA